MATKYMHLLDNKPAYFCGHHIVFAGRSRSSKPVALEDSLKTIRFHQLLTKQYRVKNGWSHSPDRYSYVRVKV